MFCFNCGCRLSEKNFCTGCGADVGLYKKIMYTANRFYNDALDKAKVRDGHSDELKTVSETQQKSHRGEKSAGTCLF